MGARTPKEEAGAAGGEAAAEATGKFLLPELFLPSANSYLRHAFLYKFNLRGYSRGRGGGDRGAYRGGGEGGRGGGFR